MKKITLLLSLFTLVFMSCGEDAKKDEKNAGADKEVCLGLFLNPKTIKYIISLPCLYGHQDKP